MNPETLKNIKDQLVAEKVKLEAELSEFAKKSGGEYKLNWPEYGDKDDENAAEVAEYETELGLGKNLESELKDVVSALKRIEDGSYGICKYCKQPIDEKRLMARPTSSSCVACKQNLKSQV